MKKLIALIFLLSSSSIYASGLKEGDATIVSFDPVKIKIHAAAIKRIVDEAVASIDFGKANSRTKNCNTEVMIFSFEMVTYGQRYL